jgi:Tfp pilus assembly protein PilO
MMTTNRRIPLIAGAAALLIIVAWYFWVWTPQAKSLQSAHKAQIAADAKIASLQSQEATYRGLLKQIPADTAKFAQLEAALPNNPQLDQALNLINQAAGATGVTVTNLSPSTPQGAAGAPAQAATPGGPAITLSMSAKGSFEQIKAFLTALTQLPRTVVVDHVSLTNSNTGATANITARIFYAGQPTP